MNHELNKTDLLLQMMEQPQRYKAEEWQEILADDDCRELYTLMSITKSAVDAAHADEEVTDEMIDDEWHKLTASHLSKAAGRRVSGNPLKKLAAMFVGILLLSGIAYAAIQIVTHLHEGLHQSTTPVASEAPFAPPVPVAPEDPADPISPKLYDNVPLGEIFEELSDYYHVKVVYQNEDAPLLRLFYRWKPEYTLEKVVEMLNNFDWIHIYIENDTLFIKTTAVPAKD